MTFQNVFITGASSGLGRGLALHYANAGSTVFAAARRLPELEALANEVKSGAGKVIRCSSTSPIWKPWCLPYTKPKPRAAARSIS
jgi:NADP-dependent 3-hydroxy acid dehydrogenase YdfG